MLEDFHPLLVLAALLLPVVGFPLVFRKWPKVGLIMLAIYVLSYIPMTVCGKYVIANHGGADWTEEWLPKWLMEDYRGFSGRTKTALTLAGAFYWPCIVLDRFLWHRTTEMPYLLPPGEPLPGDAWWRDRKLPAELADMSGQQHDIQAPTHVRLPSRRQAQGQLREAVGVFLGA